MKYPWLLHLIWKKHIAKETGISTQPYFSAFERTYFHWAIWLYSVSHPRCQLLLVFSTIFLSSLLKAFVKFTKTHKLFTAVNEASKNDNCTIMCLKAVFSRWIGHHYLNLFFFFFNLGLLLLVTRNHIAVQTKNYY